jgi:hypothetical protein
LEFGRARSALKGKSVVERMYISKLLEGKLSTLQKNRVYPPMNRKEKNEQHNDIRGLRKRCTLSEMRVRGMAEKPAPGQWVVSVVLLGDERNLYLGVGAECGMEEQSRSG